MYQKAAAGKNYSKKKSYIPCVRTLLSRHKTQMAVPIIMQYNMAIF